MLQQVFLLERQCEFKTALALLKEVKLLNYSKKMVHEIEEIERRIKFKKQLIPGKKKTKKTHKSAYVGWKFKSHPDQYPNFGTYLRAYTGINPHGQFRNIPFYDFVGLTFVYEP